MLAEATLPSAVVDANGVPPIDSEANISPIVTMAVGIAHPAPFPQADSHVQSVTADSFKDNSFSANATQKQQQPHQPDAHQLSDQVDSPLPAHQAAARQTTEDIVTHQLPPHAKFESKSSVEESDAPRLTEEAEAPELALEAEAETSGVVQEAGVQRISQEADALQIVQDAEYHHLVGVEESKQVTEEAEAQVRGVVEEVELQHSSQEAAALEIVHAAAS